MKDVEVRLNVKALQGLQGSLTTVLENINAVIISSTVESHAEWNKKEKGYVCLVHGCKEASEILFETMPEITAHLKKHGIGLMEQRIKVKPVTKPTPTPTKQKVKKNVSNNKSGKKRKKQKAHR
jgi:hypothetical protein